MNQEVRTTVDHLLNAPLFTLGQTPVTPATLVVFFLLILLTVVISRLAQRGVHHGLVRRGNTDEGTAAVVARLVTYTVVAIGFGVALSTIGVNLAVLFTAGAFFAVALGFAMQNIAQNFVGGLILLTERTIKPGDVLKVEGQVVRVSHMGLRATVARSRDDEDIIIPNSILVTNTVTNYTLRDPLYRLRTTVGVSYRSDMTLVMRTLRDAALGIPWRVADREPRILLTGFAESSVTFEVQVWTHDPWGARGAMSDLNEAIWQGFQRAGVLIPFPQLDVHVQPMPSGQPPGSVIARGASAD